ncbi:MAG: hypothetical protein EOO38_00355 [Cytophagaceae bacterium]|nr:MAG: hypothetical protein EOO38_00355 [Cytophagaceae bacterium]
MVQAESQQYALSRSSTECIYCTSSAGVAWAGYLLRPSVSVHQATVSSTSVTCIAFWLSQLVPGAMECGSFAQDARGHWYISVCVEVAGAKACGSRQIGIDLGLKTMATMSNGQQYNGLSAYRRVEQALGEAPRARKKERVKAFYAKTKNRRLDSPHKLSTQLAC